MKESDGLDEYEKDILESYERGEWRSVENLEAEIERARRYARYSIEKRKQRNEDEQADKIC